MSRLMVEYTIPCRTDRYLADAAREVGARRKLREVTDYLRGRGYLELAGEVEAHCGPRPVADPEAVDLGGDPDGAGTEVVAAR